jgi:hypothetical protein
MIGQFEYLDKISPVLSRLKGVLRRPAAALDPACAPGGFRGGTQTLNKWVRVD